MVGLAVSLAVSQTLRSRHCRCPKGRICADGCRSEDEDREDEDREEADAADSTAATIVPRLNHKRHNIGLIIVFLVSSEYPAGMRGLTAEPEIQLRDDDLLTTGEAAKVLNCTRQHVVDLCERGDLPFTTVGRHRRISRANVESLKTRTDRLSRDERRSLWLAYVVAGKIAVEPDRTIADALGHLNEMRPNARGQAKKWLDEWDRLLRGSVDRILAALIDRSLRGRELRQNSPFAGALTEQLRRKALDEWRSHDAGNPRGRR